MRIVEVKQGSIEWIEARCAIPTASRFDSIITATGKPSAAASNYLGELIAESILGTSFDDQTSEWMERGKQMEPNAVKFYEFERDIDTQEVGFVTLEDGSAGCSPDRLVGDDGGLEVKCPSPSQHVLYLLDSFGTKYKQQVQGCLWVCEREWWDMESFHPLMPAAIVRVYRDEDYIDKMAQCVTDFCERLAEAKSKVMAMTSAEELHSQLTGAERVK